ncbi:NADPH2:quinone reductase [Rhodococcus sp. 27YEA15]|uniref:NADPH:quinone oxidoreductase family protein n=1 Tax=Rhodococcus sp. 27YEA15 TaxID=3156259 RepID=UPI003C7E13D8
MRAIVVSDQQGPETIGLETVSEPRPDGASIVVDVHAVGVTFPDLLLTRGLYQYRPELPFVPGGEVAGIVRSAPPGSGFSTGDRVVGLTGVGGAMAEVVLLTPETTFPLPRHIPLTTAAGILFNYLTAHFALRHRGSLTPGESVLVHGAAGGIGTAAMTLAERLGAARTIAVVSTPEKADYVRSLGASEVVGTEQWRDDVHRMTDGRGVDIVVDPVGGDRFTDSIRSLAAGGRILVLGFTAGSIPIVKVNRLLLANVSVAGVAWGSWWMEDPRRLRTQWDELAPLLDSGQLTVPAPKVFPLEEAAEALHAMEVRSAVGKIVLALR